MSVFFNIPRYEGSDVPCVKWEFLGVWEQFWPDAVSGATNAYMGNSRT